MRNYVMSFGMNELLEYFREATDEIASLRARRAEAEYCVRLRGHRGPTKYTVLPIGWDK